MGSDGGCAMKSIVGPAKRGVTLPEKNFARGPVQSLGSPVGIA